MTRSVFTALLLCLPALAAPVDRSINYAGTLDNNGQPYTGEVQMSFRICTHVADEDGCQALGDPRAVTVAGGKFSVTLGGDEAFAALMAQDVQYFLEISVGDLGAAQLTRLGSRTPLRPRGQSLWSLRAATAGHADTAARAAIAGRADSAASADTAGRAETAATADFLGAANDKWLPVAFGCTGAGRRQEGFNTSWQATGEVEVLLSGGFNRNRHVVVMTATGRSVVASFSEGANGWLRVQTRNVDTGQLVDIEFCLVAYDMLR